MKETYEQQLIRCFKHAFYVFGTTLASTLSLKLNNLTAEVILMCLGQASVAFISAFFIAYRIICKDAILEEKGKGSGEKKISKKGQINKSAIILF